ncbi:uncharacterized protein DCS_07070 [Drechmeria coniospora]|uniref:PaxU n=1 Tax=Drechmeria coniospora TaxID=98403 RepID=A0A151GDD0_DRECN|nr:uncharacterized protein DCS_07070 [Drechmeria coniospora]KYK55108.1 uncharacterized protein DCS_07070 [Drechmeria coniospora]
MAAMGRKAPAIVGFTALSEQVFLRPRARADDGAASAGDPGTVIIYGWGDGLPKHVAKYADGYRQLYPAARQVVVLSPIAKAMFSDLQQRSGHMTDVVDAVFDGAESEEHSILVHTMSNTGAVNYAATLHAYRERYGKPLPHRVLVMDSTPGSTELTAANVGRWSRAMALGTAASFPWPFTVTQAIWGLVLCLSSAYGWIVGRESAGSWSRRAANDERYETKSARKLYLYSKDDDLIASDDIERHAAEARRDGWEADTELFRGSGHVGHMRTHPTQYWAAIRTSWAAATAASSS